MGASPSNLPPSNPENCGRPVRACVVRGGRGRESAGTTKHAGQHKPSYTSTHHTAPSLSDTRRVRPLQRIPNGDGKGNRSSARVAACHRNGSTPQHKQSHGCANTVTNAPQWSGSAPHATTRTAQPTATTGGSPTNSKRTDSKRWGGQTSTTPPKIAPGCLMSTKTPKDAENNIALSLRQRARHIAFPLRPEISKTAHGCPPPTLSRPCV